MHPYLRNILLFIGLALLVILNSCTEEDPCYYVGHGDDVAIDSEFLYMNNAGAPVMQLQLIYDKIAPEDAVYKWELNGQVSNESTMQVEGDGPMIGYVKIKSTEDDCFLYKEIDEVFDFSDCCAYLGDEDYVDVRQTINGCDGANASVILEAEFKGPSSMDLEYLWELDGQTSSGSFFIASGSGKKEGTLMVTNPIDGCYILKDIEVDFLQKAAVIGNQVWIDNRNPNSVSNFNVYDQTDTFAVDIKVSLFSYPNMELLRSTVTDHNGNYMFTELYGGEYIIQIEKPDKMLFVAKYSGSDDTEDSDINHDGFSDPFIIDDCTIDLTIDAGLKRQ